jgi:hypothetical protein
VAVEAVDRFKEILEPTGQTETPQNVEQAAVEALVITPEPEAPEERAGLSEVEVEVAEAGHPRAELEETADVVR